MKATPADIDAAIRTGLIGTATITDRTPRAEAQPVQMEPGLFSRFEKKVNKQGPLPVGKEELGHCWQWTAFKDKAGYGRLHGNGRKSPVLYAHTISFQHYRMKVPDGTELDHLCRNRGCCNPWHLEAVTHAVNFARGNAPTAILHRSGACKRGHPQGVGLSYYNGDGNIAYCIKCRIERRETEREFLDQVIALAKLNGWRTAHFRPAQKKNGQWVTAVQGDGKGFPDLVLLKGDRILCVELKTNTGEATAAQREWLVALNRAGVPACIWKPKDWEFIVRELTQ